MVVYGHLHPVHADGAAMLLSSRIDVVPRADTFGSNSDIGLLAIARIGLESVACYGQQTMSKNDRTLLSD